jgi:hypothetical protein
LRDPFDFHVYGSPSDIKSVKILFDPLFSQSQSGTSRNHWTGRNSKAGEARRINW